LSKETAFAAWQQRPKGFKGACDHCGKYGHKGVDSFEGRKNVDGAKPIETQSKFGGKCWICGKMGHRKRECRRDLNDRMRDNIAALAQTMSLFDQKKDDATQSEDGQYNEKDDNESYEELGFLVMNVADGTTRWDKKEIDTKACEELHWEPRVEKIKVAPKIEPIHENAAFVSTVINGKAFKVGSKSNSMLGDTCASNHFLMSNEAMYDCKDIHESINGIDK